MISINSFFHIGTSRKCEFLHDPADVPKSNLEASNSSDVGWTYSPLMNIISFIQVGKSRTCVFLHDPADGPTSNLAESNSSDLGWTQQSIDDDWHNITFIFANQTFRYSTFCREQGLERIEYNNYLERCQCRRDSPGTTFILFFLTFILPNVAGKNKNF